jgi:hypothetical protein
VASSVGRATLYCLTSVLFLIVGGFGDKGMLSFVSVFCVIFVALSTPSFVSSYVLVLGFRLVLFSFLFFLQFVLTLTLTLTLTLIQSPGPQVGDTS